MSNVRRNVVANFAGQIWSALMGVVFIPIYIHLMGLEAYGLIGFFVTLQALAVVFDLGLAGTINRELARRGAAEALSTRDLVRTLEWIYWPLGVLVALLVWAFSGMLGQSWVRPVDLSAGTVGTAIALMGAAIGGQWPSAFYVGGLNGLQRQVLANALIALFGTLRGAGVLLPLALVAPTIEVFFIWQAAVGLLQSAALAAVLWRALPPGGRPPRFAAEELAKVGAFTLGLTGIALLSFLLMQADRIVLSRLLPLDQFGIYALAASVATAILRLVQPWFNALYPRFAELQAGRDEPRLCSLYHVSSQWLAVTVLPVVVVVAIFSGDVLRVWTTDAGVAAQAAPILTVLAFGTGLNALMNLPYAMQLAHGWTRFALWTNVVSVCVLVPGVVALVEKWGAVGAACGWLILNLTYVLVALPLMHRHLLKGELAAWYLHDVGGTAAASLVVALALRSTVAVPQDTFTASVTLVAVYAMTLAAALLASAAARRFALGKMMRLIWWN